MKVVLLFVVIAILAVSALQFVQGSSGSGSDQQQGQGGQSCAPNGTPCNYKGIGGFTDCCTKYCLQFPEESMGRCADPGP